MLLEFDFWTEFFFNDYIRQWFNFIIYLLPCFPYIIRFLLHISVSSCNFRIFASATQKLFVWVSPDWSLEASPYRVASFMYHRRQSFRIVFILNINNIFRSSYWLNYLFLVKNRVNNLILTGETNFIALEYLHELICNINEILKCVSHILN